MNFYFCVGWCTIMKAQKTRAIPHSEIKLQHILPTAKDSMLMTWQRKRETIGEKRRIELSSCNSFVIISD